MATTIDTSLSRAIATFNKQVDFGLAPAIQLANDGVTVTKTGGEILGGKPGATVTWTKQDRIPTNTTPLSQTASGTAVSLSDSQVTVTLQEYGNFVVTTEKLEKLSFDDIKRTANNVVVDNAARTIDEIYMGVANAETGAAYNTYGPLGTRTSKATIVKTDIVTGAAIVDMDATLRSRNVKKVMTPTSEAYLGHLHSDVIADLRGNAAFREVSLYARPEDRLRGEVGMYEGIRVVENNAVPVDYKAGEEAQAATTVSGAHSAGATVVAVVSATGIIAGNVIVITVGTDEYAYEVLSVATNDITIGACVRLNGFYYPGTSGLVTALSGGEAVEESAAVYTCYFMGQDVFAKAEATAPELRLTKDNADAYDRQNRLAWYALWGLGIYEVKSLQKMFVSSTRSANQ